MTDKNHGEFVNPAGVKVVAETPGDAIRMRYAGWTEAKPADDKAKPSTTAKASA